MKPGRLPEVKAIFKGNFGEWETFWSSFRTNVDVRNDIEKSTKFIYLAQSLEGEPKEMISGLAITDDNYTIAIRILNPSDPVLIYSGMSENVQSFDLSRST